MLGWISRRGRGRRFKNIFTIDSKTKLKENVKQVAHGNDDDYDDNFREPFHSFGTVHDDVLIIMPAIKLEPSKLAYLWPKTTTTV